MSRPAWHRGATTIEADEPRKISPFGNMGLLELIVKTGIADAIASQLGGLKGNRMQSPRADRVAESKAEYTVSGDAVLDLALQIDATVRPVKPDEFRGHQARENTIKAALLPLPKNEVDEVERIFLIIKAQREY